MATVKEILETMRAEIAHNLDDKKITATGRTRDGLKVEEYDGGCRLVATQGAPIATTEIGSGPHWVPIAPLKEWVQVKLGLPEGAAYAVQKKIAAEGTDRYTNPRNDIYTDVVERHLPEIERACGAWASEIIANINK